MEAITDKDLQIFVSEFITGLLNKAGCTHAGNCLTVSEVLQGYLSLFDIETDLMNAKVKQVGTEVNHYYLQMKDGRIIDATASQFKTPTGATTPRVYIGNVPQWYQYNKAA